MQPSAGDMRAMEARKYTLVFEVVDDSKVDVLRFPVAGCTDVEEFRFPKAGSHNSVSHLRIVQVRLNSRLRNPKSLQLAL